jgi:hypothetical protein
VTIDSPGLPCYALETQFRTSVAGTGRVQVSYTLSRSYLDGVEFFIYPRGTQRTP